MRLQFAIALMLVVLGAAPVAPQAYVGGASVVGSNVFVGILVCQSNLGPGVGGVCNLDCTGSAGTCLVSNDNPADALRACWDTNGDRSLDTCSGVGWASLGTGGWKGTLGVFVLVGGSRGTITAFDP